MTPNEWRMGATGFPEYPRLPQVPISAAKLKYFEQNYVTPGHQVKIVFAYDKCPVDI
jgi:hypothetical protein